MSNLETNKKIVGGSLFGNNPVMDSGLAPWESPQESVAEPVIEVGPEPIFDITEAHMEVFAEEIKKKESELKEVKLDLISLGAWSNSKYKSLKKCPFQFYLKYILKFKVPSHFQIQDDPISAPVGTAAHEILEKVMLGKKLDKAVSEVRHSNITKKILTPTQWEERVDPLQYNISQFVERIEDFNRRNPIKRVLTELRIGVTRKYEATGFFADDVWLRGVIDLVLLLECMDAVILDHKTGGGQGSVRVYQDQLDWYKVLLHFGIQKVVGAQSGVHFIGAGEVKMAEYSEAKHIESNLINTLEMSLEGAIDSMVEKGFFKHVRGSYCKWCEFDSIGCKSGALKPIELGTKKWIQIHKG